MFYASILTVILLTAPNLNGAVQPAESCVKIVSEEESEIVLSFHSPDLEISTINLDGDRYSKVSVASEGQIGMEGFPDLPVIHRTVIVPPRAGIRLEVLSDEQTVFQAAAPPAVFTDNPEGQPLDGVQQFNQVFPSSPFVLNEPVIFRGRRMVTVTHYPCQYDPGSNSYIQHNDAQVALRFTPADPDAKNPVQSDREITLTRGSYRMLRALAMNAPHRDDGGATLPRGGYLIVAGAGNVFERSEDIPKLADWKRAFGHQVEVQFNNNVREIEEMIEDRYEEWDPPLEYVCIIGGLRNPSAPNGEEGDVMFGMLEGNDHVAEVAVTRMSAESDQRINVVINRALGYQVEPFMEDTEWFGIAGSAANSFDGWYEGVNHTVHWIAEAARRADFHTAYEYVYNEQNQDGTPNQWMNDGLNILFLRGGQHVGNPSDPIFPIFLSVGGGHVEGTWTGMWRTGSPNNLSGPSIVSGSEHNQATLACNVLLGGMARGLLVEKMPVGWARAFAMSMLDYDNVNGNNYNFYLEEFRMYAEPGQLVWCSVPTELLVEHPNHINTGQNLISICVGDADREISVSGALVTLTEPGELLTWGFTDQDGYCTLPIDPDQDEDIILTVTGDGLLPYQAELNVITAPVFVTAYISDIDDEEDGNNDGELNPGETAGIRITASNLGDENMAHNVVGVVRTDCPWITLDNPRLEFGDIEPEEESRADEELVLTLSPSSHETDELNLFIELEYDNITSTHTIPLDLVGHRLDLHRVVGGEILQNGIANIDLEIENSGSRTSPDMLAELFSTGWEIQVLQDESHYRSLEPDRTSTLTGDPFQVSPVSFAVPGSRILMYLLLRTQEQDVPDTVKFYLQVGESREHTPQGPDEYGYICVDDTDEEWGVTPEFDWIEISREARDPDYHGTLVDVDEETDFTVEIDLPFTFRYYGEDFDDATVSENGFLAMGTGIEQLVSYENYPLDQFVNGSFGMIAPLWDNLRILRNYDGGVYTYHEQDMHVFIIEWFNAIYPGDGEEFSFQIILYDPEFYPNPSGDGNILFQYRDIPDPYRGVAPNYFSTGICSPDGSIGLNYVDNNDYPVTSAEIEDGRAILFTTTVRYGRGVLNGTVTDAANNRPIPGASIVTKFGQIAFTDENGEWIIEDAIAEYEFDITAFKQGYNDSIRYDFTLENEGELTIDFSLLHPQFVSSTHFMADFLDPDRQSEFPFTLSNTGNGPMDWILERKLHGDANAAPWEHRRSFFIGQAVDDDHIEGVVFAENHFFVSGGNVGYPTIYKFDRNGALIDTFAQFNQDYNRGMRDMTWDGELIWSAVNDSIYGFTTDGELRTVFGGFRDLLPFRPVTNIGYDEDNQLLWISGTTTDIFAITRDAELVDSLQIDRKGLRIYGLDCYEDDIDGYTLYVLTREDGSNRHRMVKFNTFTGDTIHVAYVDHEIESGTAGMCITNQYDVYSWILVEIASASVNMGGDRIDLWQIEGRKDWFQIDILEHNRRVEADSGRIECGETSDFILTFDSTDLPDTLFRGELLFHHNSDSGKAHIELELQVIGPVAPTPFDLVSPADGDTLDSTLVAFNWNPSIDYNFDEVPAYRLHLGSGLDSVFYETIDTTFTVDIDTVFGLDPDESALFNWRVEAVSDPDVTPCNQPFIFRFIPAWMQENNPETLVEFGLHSIYPNPFNATTTVRFGIDRTNPTTLTVYDLAGRRIKELFAGKPEVGYHRVVWNAESVPSGLYLLRLSSASGVRTAKLAFIK